MKVPGLLLRLQRGGRPTTFNRALCSMIGATAVELIAAGDFGKMVTFTGRGGGRRRSAMRSDD
jgi:6-phosphofructokinase